MEQVIWHPYPSNKPQKEGLYVVHVADNIESKQRYVLWLNDAFYDIKTKSVFLLNVDQWAEPKDPNEY